MNLLFLKYPVYWGRIKKATYEDIYYSLLERLAGIYEIDKFNIYTDEELLNLIKKKNYQKKSTLKGMV